MERADYNMKTNNNKYQFTDDMKDTFCEFIREQNENLSKEIVDYFIIVVLGDAIKTCTNSQSEDVSFDITMLKNPEEDSKDLKDAQICRYLYPPVLPIENYMNNPKPMHLRKISKVADDSITPCFVYDRLRTMIFDEIKRRIYPYTDRDCMLMKRGLNVKAYNNTWDVSSKGEIGMRISGSLACVTSFYYDQVQAYEYAHNGEMYKESISSKMKSLTIAKNKFTR